MAAEPSDREGARPVLLYLFPKRSVFIERDLELLAAHFQVRAHELLRGPTWALPLRLLSQLLFLLRNRAWRQVVVCHFAGYHSVLPTLLCRRTFIVLAGSDCASFPELDYGNFRKGLYGRATAFSVRWAARLLPVHQSLMGMEQDYDASGPRHQGMKAFVPELHTPFTEIPYGFDASFWTPGELPADRGKLLCVASGARPDNNTHGRKGVDLILKVAPLLPELRFLIVGSPDPDAYQDLPPNLSVLGPQDALSIRQRYREAGLLLQVSVMEGFPNALCEGMLCGCVPIVSNMAAMPDIVGNTGVIVPERTTEALLQAIRDLQALSTEELADRSMQARERIAARYSRARRERELLAVITGGSEAGREVPG